jgi:hypothetical protein
VLTETLQRAEHDALITPPPRRRAHRDGHAV